MRLVIYYSKKIALIKVLHKHKIKKIKIKKIVVLVKALQPQSIFNYTLFYNR